MDPDGPPKGEIALTIVRGVGGKQQQIASTSVRNPGHLQRAAFSFEVAEQFGETDLLNETIKVKAINRDGTTGILSLDGAAHLHLIKKHLGPPSVSVLDIDFSTAGNSDSFIVSGFSWAEEHGRWTIGAESLLILPTPREEGRFYLRMVVEPYLALPRPARQSLSLDINTEKIGDVDLAERHARLLDFQVDFSSIKGSSEFALRLHHPDAACPVHDAGPHRETRDLAIAFKTLSLLRHVPSNKL